MATTVIFVHGLWLHANAWQSWVDHFNAAGYDARAPGWPGEGSTVAETRANANNVAGFGIDAVVGHYADVIAALPEKPVVIGHSFGGLVAQRLLAEGRAAAAVGIDAAPIKGVKFLPFSALRVASVALRNPANRKRAVSLTRRQFRYGFGNAVSEAESDALYEQWAIPSPGRPLFEAAVANFSSRSPAKVDTRNPARGPLLLTAGGRDRTVPRSVTSQTRKLYDGGAITEVEEFPDRGHSLTIDSGWREVADATLTWVRGHAP